MRSSSHPSAAGFEFAIVGAGVIGLAIAERLARRGRSVILLECGEGIGRGITSRNSEVIHAGIYYPAESMKARFCVDGRRLLYDWCEKHRVGHRRLGKLIVATEVDEEPILEDLLARGRANGVERLELIGGESIASLEPAIVAQSALFSADTGIVDAHALCLSLLAQTESVGGVLALEREVVALETTSYGWRLATRGGAGETETIDVGCVVDAAGLEADRIAELAGLPVDRLGWRQQPCKGDYFSVEGRLDRSIDHLIYPVPGQAGLGIHATLDLGGRVRFGPDAEYVTPAASPSEAPSAFDFAVDPSKAGLFREAVRRYWPAIDEVELVPDYAGIRPKLAGPGEAFRDFVIEDCSAHGAPGFVACLGIESPGLTAALAIADHVSSWGTP